MRISDWSSDVCSSDLKEREMNYTKYAAAALMAGSTGLGTAHATENGGGVYPNGAESIGVAQLPPPGTYLLGYSNYYTADRLNDANGDSAVPDFSVDASATIARLGHVPDKMIIGATVAMQTIFP